MRGKGDEASLFLDRLSALGLVTEVLQHRDTAAGETTFRLSDAAALRLTPGGDTTGLAASLHLDLEGSSDDQEREILLAMLACPVRFEYASFAALASSVQVRRNIANAAARTDAYMMNLCAQQLGKNDVAMFVSRSGQTNELLEAAGIAQELGAKVFSLAPSNSAIAKKSDVLIVVNTNETRQTKPAMLTRILQLALIDVLAVGLTAAEDR